MEATASGEYLGYPYDDEGSESLQVITAKEE
jgi:hypothetical protein